MNRLITFLLAFWLSCAPSLAAVMGSGDASAPSGGGNVPQASITELQARGTSLKPSMFGPAKGLFTNVSDLLRDEQAAKVLNNLQMLKRGVWTSRGIGWTKERVSTFNSGAAFLEMTTHTNEDGVNRFVFQVGDKIYSYDLSTHTETQIQGSVDASATPCFRSFSQSIMLWCNGVQQPKKWDGDPSHTMTAVTGWPVTIDTIQYTKPKYTEVFASRAVWAGFEKRPFSVVLSVQDDPEDYTSGGGATDAGVFDVPAVLGKIKALRSLRLNTDTNEQVLLIGCERGVAIITGSSGTTFGLKEVTREFGVLSNRCWIQLQNDLLFLSTDGIRRFSQVIASSNLTNASLTFGIQDVVSGISTTYADKAFAIHYPATQEVQFWIPYGADTTNAHCLVLNYNTQDPSAAASSSGVGSLDFIISTKDGTSVSCGQVVGGVMYGGGYTGLLQQHYSGDTYDGSDINWEYVSALVGTNSPAQNASARKFVLITDGGAQGFTLNAYTVDQLASGDTEWRARDSRRVSVASSTITKIGTWASGTTTTYPKFEDFAPKGSGRYWCLQAKSTQSGDHIALVGVMSILTVGGWKQ